MMEVDRLRRTLLAGRGNEPLRKLGLEAPLSAMKLVSMGVDDLGR